MLDTDFVEVLYDITDQKQNKDGVNGLRTLVVSASPITVKAKQENVLTHKL